MNELPNAVIEGVSSDTNKQSAAMRALEKVTAPPVNSPTDKKIPESIPVTKPPMKGETSPAVEDEFDFGEPTQKEELDRRVSVEDTDDIDKIVDIKGTSAENMKRLRTKLKSTHQEREALKNEAETLKKKVSEYESGLVIPEQLQTMQSRIDELEPFEKIYKLEQSPAYAEAIGKPLDAARTKLIDLATDYEVPLEVLDQALATTNRADLNRLLGQHFDEVGALEAKSLLNSMKEINQKAQEAKKEPSAALARLHKQTQDAMEEKRKVEIAGISSIAKSAWIESLTSLREENHVNLSFREGDTEHNETIAKPILNKASRDFGVVVRALGENGLKQLPQEISYVIARSIQLSHESAILRHQNNEMVEELTSLRKRVGNLNSMNRPGANGGGTSNGYSNTGTREKGGVGAARAAWLKLRKINLAL